MSTYKRSRHFRLGIELDHKLVELAAAMSSSPSATIRELIRRAPHLRPPQSWTRIPRPAMEELP
jgi:hypothetical protein